MVTVTPADKIEDTKFDLLEGDRPILRGDSVTVVAALKEFTPPGTFVGLRLSGGKTGVFQVRSPEEREAGVPVKVMMSKHRAPLAVADQDPVASRAGLRSIGPGDKRAHVLCRAARCRRSCAQRRRLRAYGSSHLYRVVPVPP